MGKYGTATPTARSKAMLRAWGFALTLALCCTLGWSTAHATGKITKIVTAMGKSELLAALIESAKGRRSIKNGKLYLDRPIKFTLPDGTPVEQSEFEIKAIKSLWPTLPISCLLWAKCRHSLDE
jgi:hypothetical protein